MIFWGKKKKNQRFSTLSYFSNSSLSSWLQFLPIGDTLSMPLRNSINVPLNIYTENLTKLNIHTHTYIGFYSTNLFIGISKSAI
jgi:hypothetical protein